MFAIKAMKKKVLIVTWGGAKHAHLVQLIRTREWRGFRREQ